MSDSYFSIVPLVEDFPKREEKATEILTWLVSLDVVKMEKSDSVLGSAMGHSVSEGARNIVESPEDLPFDLWTNGLEIITEKQVFDSGENYEEGDELPTSNLGFTFWNWPDFTDLFLDEFQKKLGHEIILIEGRI